jgi:hypothetical protein
MVDLSELHVRKSALEVEILADNWGSVAFGSFGLASYWGVVSSLSQFSSYLDEGRGVAAAVTVGAITGLLFLGTLCAGKFIESVGRYITHKKRLEVCQEEICGAREKLLFDVGHARYDHFEALDYDIGVLRNAASRWYVDPEEANLAIIKGKEIWVEKERKRLTSGEGWDEDTGDYDPRFRDSQ